MLDFSGMHLAVLSVAGVITSVGEFDTVSHCVLWSYCRLNPEKY